MVIIQQQQSWFNTDPDHKFCYIDISESFLVSAFNWLLKMWPWPSGALGKCVGWVQEEEGVGWGDESRDSLVDLKTHTHTHTHIHTHTVTHTHNINTYWRACICIHTYTHTYCCTHECMHTHIHPHHTFTQVSICIDLHAYIRHICMFIHTDAHAYIPCTHTHTHPHTQLYGKYSRMGARSGERPGR